MALGQALKVRIHQGTGNLGRLAFPLLPFRDHPRLTAEVFRKPVVGQTIDGPPSLAVFNDVATGLCKQPEHVGPLIGRISR